jgi:hypothetical protein
MKNLNAQTLLVAIANLEENKRIQETEIKQLYTDTINGFKPGNIIKNGIQNLVQGDGLKSKIIQTALSVGMGYATNKFLLNKVPTKLKTGLSAVLNATIGKLFQKR